MELTGACLAECSTEETHRVCCLSGKVGLHHAGLAAHCWWGQACVLKSALSRLSSGLRAALARSPAASWLLVERVHALWVCHSI